MNCLIYRSEKKPGAYLYLAEEKAMEDIPDELLQLLGHCIQVMELDLNKQQKLATEDIEAVRQNIKHQGYHLQMPPKNSTHVLNYGR